MTVSIYCFLLLVLIWPGQAVNSAIAYVSPTNGTSLLDALRNDTITTIVLTSDYDIGNEFADYAGAKAPLQITRNITITGQPGSKPLLNLRFQRSSLELCTTCKFTLRAIGIAQERRGNGASVDFFTGQPGSVLMADDIVRVRPACTSTASTIDLIIKDQKRSPRFPLPGAEQKQIIGVTNATYQGVTYSNMLLLIDFAYDVPLSYQEALGNMGGYTLRVINTTRLCDHMLSGDCLAIKSPDACVNDLIDQLLVQGQQQPTTRQVAVGVAVGVGAGVAFLAAAALLYRRHKLSLHGKTVPSTASGIETGRGSGGVFNGGAPEVEPLVDTTGWKIVSINTTPSVGPLADTRIQLGVMLGAGSFGRVYKGRWAGREVAVKVIEHESAAAVENEVQLMLSISHSNVVRAYHYVTYSHITTHMDDNDTSANPATRSGGIANLQPSTVAMQQPQPWHLPRASMGRITQSSTTASGATHVAPTMGSALRSSYVTSAKPVVVDDSTLDNSYAVSDNSPPKQQHQAGCRIGNAVTAMSDYAPPIDQEGQLQQHMHEQQQQLFEPGVVCSASRQQTANGSDSSLALGGPTTMPSISTSAAAGPPFASDSGRNGTGAPSAFDSWLVGSGERSLRLGSKSSHGSKPSGVIREIERSRTWLVQEYCNCGTLSSWVGKVLQDPANNDQLLQLLLLLQDAAQGVQHLHAKSIVHGDLNARNVLVSSTTSGGVTAKLADLGISRVIKQHSTHRTTTTVGTMSHMPPELLRYGRMSPAVDVYAFGVMMWELYTGQIAFKRLQYGQFFEHVVLRNSRPPIPPDMPDDYNLLLTTCWAVEPSERPSISAVLNCLGLMIQERQQHLQQ